MAIIAVYPDWHGASYEVNERGEKTAVAVVQVQTDDDTSGKVTPWKSILMDSRFPQRGTFFGQGGAAIGVSDFDSELALFTIRADSESSTMALKRLTLTYKSVAQSPKDTAPNKDKGKGGNPKDPENEEPEIEIDYQPYGRVPARDINGKAIVNSAHDPLEPVMITFLQKVIHYKCQLSEADHDEAQGLGNTINSAPISILGQKIDAGGGKVGGFRSSRKKKNGKVYFETTITILDRSDDPDGWRFLYLDVGNNYIDPESWTKKSAIIVNGTNLKLQSLTGGFPSDEPDILEYFFLYKVNWNHFEVFKKEAGKG